MDGGLVGAVTGKVVKVPASTHLALCSIVQRGGRLL